jgi:membrane protein YqaA with SNARE-associated domain
MPALLWSFSRNGDFLSMSLAAVRGSVVGGRCNYPLGSGYGRHTTYLLPVS